MADPSTVLLWIKYLKSSLYLLSTFFIFFFFFTTTVRTQTLVQTLPGFSGTLPFKLETGYIGVGDEFDRDVKLFYYFIESESDPENDPVLLWLTGGPGCSGFSGLVYEIGPLNFNYEAFDGRLLPSLLLNPYSWTKVASIIFLDAPVGTGFSYATTPGGYNTSDTETVHDIYSFLQQWFLKHPKFMKNRLYIAGDSYTGMWVPIIAWKISEDNNEGIESKMNLECTDNIYLYHVLEPACKSKPQKTIRIMQSSNYLYQCRDDFDDLLSSLWANDAMVQEALHIRKGTIKEWKRCFGKNLPYVQDIESAVYYHKLLTNKQYHALAYSGDHDMLVPYIGTMEWIRQLNLTLDDDWRPWIVDDQIAGYTERHTNGKGQFNITFATVKGAGHTAPEYKGKECFAMVKKFLSYYPL